MIVDRSVPKRKSRSAPSLESIIRCGQAPIVVVALEEGTDFDDLALAESTARIDAAAAQGRLFDFERGHVPVLDEEHDEDHGNEEDQRNDERGS